jgi:hypothetical protein
MTASITVASTAIRSRLAAVVGDDFEVAALLDEETLAEKCCRDGATRRSAQATTLWETRIEPWPGFARPYQ